MLYRMLWICSIHVVGNETGKNTTGLRSVDKHNPMYKTTESLQLLPVWRYLLDRNMAAFSPQHKGAQNLKKDCENCPVVPLSWCSCVERMRNKMSDEHRVQCLIPCPPFLSIFTPSSRVFWRLMVTFCRENVKAHISRQAYWVVQVFCFVIVLLKTWFILAVAIFVLELGLLCCGGWWV